MMSAGLVAAIWIGVPFLAATAAIGLTRLPAALVVCSMPFVAVVVAFIELRFFVAATASNSTAPIIIPGSFVYAILGSLPGVVAGLTIRKLRSGRNRGRA
jgi:hypothetical protein